MSQQDLVPMAATDLVNRISNEINYIFDHRYTDYGGGKKVQTNPYATMTEVQQAEAVVEALAMVLGQIGAQALVEDQKLDNNTVFGNFAKRIRKHGEAYHQQFLHMRETQNGKQPSPSEGTQGRNAPATPDIPDRGCEGTGHQGG